MDGKSKTILVGFTNKQKCSQLTPHRDLICKLHQRGCTFREIVRILSENFSLTVAHTTICRFIARMEQETAKPQKQKQRKEKPLKITPREHVAPPVASSNEVRQRIAVLKQQAAQVKSDIKQFDYDPDQPLHLVPKDA